MKNPYECNDIDELRDIAFCWMQISNRLKAEKRVLSDILLENGINPTLDEIIARLNKIAFD